MMAWISTLQHNIPRRPVKNLHDVNDLPEQCPVCGIPYRAFRTGHTFTTVREMLWTPGPPPWRQKRRRSVLGLWRQIKQCQWQLHLDECEQAAELQRQLEEVPF